jgi:hypothetical protein
MQGPSPLYPKQISTPDSALRSKTLVMTGPSFDNGAIIDGSVVYPDKDVSGKHTMSERCLRAASTNPAMRSRLPSVSPRSECMQTIESLKGSMDWECGTPYK